MFPAPLLGSKELGSHCAQSVSLLVTSPLSLILGTQLSFLFECGVAILLALSSHDWSNDVLNVIFTAFKRRWKCVEISSDLALQSLSPPLFCLLYTREGLTHCPCSWATRCSLDALESQHLESKCWVSLAGGADWRGMQPARWTICGYPRTIPRLLPWFIHSSSEQPGFLPWKVQPAFNFGCWWGSGE